MFKSLLLFSSLCIFNVSVYAGNYNVGTVYSPLSIGTSGTNGGSCSTWYNPTVYVAQPGIYNRDPLQVLAQGGNNYRPLDSFFATERLSSGTWSIVSESTPPEFVGSYTRCNYSNTSHGPVASPSVVQVPGDSRYFMAFSGGNADFISGEVYWAVSSEGTQWTPYNLNPPPGETWTHLVYGKYAGCAGGTSPYSDGIGQVHLGYQNGYFYLFVQYYHSLSLDPPNGGQSVVVYRFPYSSSDQFGIGHSGGQVYHNGVWENNSGALVWEYDGLGSDGTQLPNGDRVLGTDQVHSMTTYGFGTGDQAYDPSRGAYLHVYDALAGFSWQTNAMGLDQDAWSTRANVGGNVPANYVGAGSGLYYGTLSGVTGMFVFLPVKTNSSCTTAFAGLSLAPATLAYQ